MARTSPTSITYGPCLTNPTVGKRYGKNGVARTVDVMGNVICHGCGADHDSTPTKTYIEIAHELRAHFIKEGVNLNDRA